MSLCLSSTIHVAVAQYDSRVFDERSFTPNILVLSGGLAGGSYYPYPFFHTRPVSVQYYCSICMDSAYLTDPDDWTLAFPVYGGCTQGLYNALLNDNIDFVSWFRLQFRNGVLIANSGFGVTPYALGQVGYDDLKAFMDSLVADEDAVFQLNRGDTDMVRRYGYSYTNNPPSQVRFYKRIYEFTGYEDVTFNIPCGDASHYVRYTYGRIVVYFLAAADGSDVQFRWQRYYYPAIVNFLRFGLPRYYPQLFQHPASRVEFGYWGQYLIYRLAYRHVEEMVFIPSVPFEVEQYLEQCSLCQLLNAIDSLVQAYNWDSDADYWQTVRNTRVVYPNYQSWKDFLSNLIQAVRPVYRPCLKVDGSFIERVSIAARYPPDALETGIGSAGTLIRDAIQQGRYIPVLYTRSAFDGFQGSEHFVFLNTCSPGMAAFAASTRFASYVLFTIWFAFALRRAIMHAFDLVRGDGGEE